MNESSTPIKSDDVLLLLGRVALGAIFVKSGIQKLLALSVFAASLAQRGIPQSEMWAVIGATIEFVGGILIITGFQTRFASLLMILFVIVATGISHRFWEFAGAARRAQESQFFKNISIIRIHSCCTCPLTLTLSSTTGGEGTYILPAQKSRTPSSVFSFQI